MIMRRIISIAVCLPLLLLEPACNDELTIEGIEVNTAGDEPVVSVSDAGLQLVDADGNAVTDLSPHWGRYYVQVNESGRWHLSGEGGFVVPTVTHGEGPQLVPVIVGENWTTARQGALCLVAEEASDSIASRAESGSRGDSTRIVVPQMTNDNLQEVKKILSSNKGAGYGYSYSGDFCLGTTIEIFNMRSLDSLQSLWGYEFIDDDYCPHVEQSMFTGYSKEECNNKLAISASLGVEYNKVNVKVSGNYSSSENEDKSTQYARSRINGSVFSREVHHYNILAVARENETHYKELYSPGFRLVSETLTQDLKAAVGGNWDNYPTAQTDSICRVFCEEVGPCLITKSLMGCSLDYSMSISSESLGDSMTCGGSLELKIKFATASIDVKAQGQYTNEMETIERNASFECAVYGGEVMGVSILASGGTLVGDEVTVWQQSVLPSTAVMVDMRLAPIYSIIYDANVQAILREYENRMVSASDPAPALDE